MILTDEAKKDARDLVPVATIDAARSLSTLNGDATDVTAHIEATAESRYFRQCDPSKFDIEVQTFVSSERQGNVATNLAFALLIP